MVRLYRATESTQGETKYFPERYLCQRLASQGTPEPIYFFEKAGLAHLRAAYARLVDDLELDAIVLSTAAPTS